MSNVQALEETEHAKYLKLLELFAYGTYSEYVENSANYPEMSKKMTKKLQQLSIVSLAHRNKKVPYCDLQAELGVTNVRELEDLIIETIYAGLLEGRLDQHRGVLNVKTAMARDVRPEDVGAIIAKLSGWGDTVRGLLEALETNAAKTVQTREATEARKQQVKSDIEAAKKTLEKRGNSGNALGMGGFDVVDMDDRREMVGGGNAFRRPNGGRRGGGGNFPGEGIAVGRKK